MKPGTRLGSYEILEPLGKGGMGEVWLAEDTTLRRPVALKVLPEDVADDPKLLSRLRREARTLAALDHPNIVGIYSIEEQDGVSFLTMAYVEGATLDDSIPETGLPPERALEMAVPLADALAAAHEQGIVHRDLKPANIMVQDSGRVRVLDFGIAKQLRQVRATRATEAPTAATVTELGTMIGTIPYMSPEQAEGKDIDIRSDIFSFGVVIYEMVAGVRPFNGSTPTALVSSILKDTPPPLNHLRPGVPAGLARVISRCLEKDPEDRYQSAEDLRDDLEELRTGRARLSGRQKLGIGVALATAVLAGGWAIWQAPAGFLDGRSGAVMRTPAISSLAVLPLRNATGDPEQDYFADGMTEALVTDLAKIGSLKVISRSAAMRYAGTDKTPQQIAQELGVDALVEGSVLREEDRVGITVQLVEADTASTLWGERYEQELTSILNLQADIAREIAAEIEINLEPDEERLLTGQRRIVDPEAYEAYLKGVSHWNKLTPADLENALRYFERTLDLEPRYAPAHVGVANVWLGRQQMGIVPPSVGTPLAKAAATRATEIDETLADAHRVLGTIAAWGEWDWAAAIREYERALEIQPNDPEALLFYSHVLVLTGQPEAALERAARGIELDPFDPLYKSLYGGVLWFTGRYEEAVSIVEDAVRIVPNHLVALEILWLASVELGRPEQALEAARRRFAAGGEDQLVAALDGGRPEEGYRAAMARAADVLDRRPPDEFLPALHAVGVYVGAGEPGAALTWMERAVSINDPSLPYLTAAPFAEELRGRPRYAAVAEALGLSSER